MNQERFLELWGVRTLLPLRTLERLAVRCWALQIERQSGLSAYKISEVYLFNERRGKPSTAFFQWRKAGYPSPQFLRPKSTAPGPAILLNQHFPGSLRVLLHPGWTLLAGPLSLQTCHALICLLDSDVRNLLMRRVPYSEPPTRAELAFDSFERRSILWVDVNETLAVLKEIGSMDAFFGAVALVVEYALTAHFGTPEQSCPVFRARDWEAFLDMPKEFNDSLDHSCDLLRMAYSDICIPCFRLEEAIENSIRIAGVRGSLQLEIIQQELINALAPGEL